MSNYNSCLIERKKILSVPNSVQAVTMMGVNLCNMAILIAVKVYSLYIG